MSTKKETLRNNISHPGEKLKEILESKGISQKDFSQEIDIAYTQLNEIIKGKRNITPDIAILLETSLEEKELDAEYWLNHQIKFNLEKSRIEVANQLKVQRLKRWNEFKDIVPISFFKKHNYLTGNLDEDEQRILSIYGARDLVDLQKNFFRSLIRYKKSEKFIQNKKNIYGWVKLMMYLAKSQNVGEFNPSAKEDLVKKLKQVFLGVNVFDNTKRLLAEAGIKLVKHTKPEQSPVDGIAFWDNNTPCIGISMRYARIDNFAFTILHECLHVFDHLPKDKNSEYIDNWSDEDSQNFIEEIEANEFARNSLIPFEKWISFTQNSFKFDDFSILKFAQEIETHPAIVRGRLCYEGLMSYKVPTDIDYSIY